MIGRNRKLPAHPSPRAIGESRNKVERAANCIKGLGFESSASWGLVSLVRQFDLSESQFPCCKMEVVLDNNEGTHLEH